MSFDRHIAPFRKSVGTIAESISGVKNFERKLGNSSLCACAVKMRNGVAESEGGCGSVCTL